MLKFRFLPLAFFFSLCSVSAQSPLQIYVVSEFYNEHKAEADSALQELLDGTVGPVLTRFINDTVWGEHNQLYIDSIFSNDGFRLANTVDTIPTPGTGPPRYTTQVAYRKLSEYMGEGFQWYRLWLGISWNSNYDVFARKLTLTERTIRTKKDWNWMMWRHPCPKFLPKN